jgi:hypothetical protein
VIFFDVLPTFVIFFDVEPAVRTARKPCVLPLCTAALPVTASMTRWPAQETSDFEKLLPVEPKLQVFESRIFDCADFATSIVLLCAQAVVEPTSETPTAAVIMPSENTERRGVPRPFAAVFCLPEEDPTRGVNFSSSLDVGCKVFKCLSKASVGRRCAAYAIRCIIKGRAPTNASFFTYLFGK